MDVLSLFVASLAAVVKESIDIRAKYAAERALHYALMLNSTCNSGGAATTQTVLATYVTAVSSKAIAETTEGSVAFIRDFARKNTNSAAVNYDSSDEI